MSVTIQKTNQLKSIAILMMLGLHLFNRDYTGLFQPLIFIGNQPLSYYVSLFCDACVPIFAFVSGYGLYYSYQNDEKSFTKKNIVRSKKLYLRYWIILVLFVVLLGMLLNKEGYPGSWKRFFLNFTAIDPNYNGAWWYFTTYVAFIFTCKFWFRLIDKLSPYFYISTLFLVYVIAFYFRIYQTNIFENSFLQWLHTQTALYFCTLFQFMLGAFTLKYHWHSRVSNVFDKIKYVNIVSIVGIALLIVFHGLVPNFIVAPLTALGFIFLFLQLRLFSVIDKGLDFFSAHSTNLWLIHMFFYMIYFEEIIYAPQYPFVIFIWLVLWCLIASYIVNLIYNKSEKAIL